ncbi:MAG: RidA family protein [Geminicoccales bacterium]
MFEKITAPDAHSLNSGYSQAIAVTDAKRTVYVSGQIGLRPDGSLPDDFSGQARQVWLNIEAQLKAAGMGLDNIVHHTTFLSDRKYRAESSEIRKEVFGDLEPALTVIIAGIFDEAWLLEIQAIAAE